MTTYLTQRNSNQDFQCNQNKPCSITKSYSSRTIVHPKLEMTEPGDHDEQEADAVANTIAAGGKISRKISGGSGSSGITVSNQMESQLNHLQGGSQSMPTGLRNMMESGFGQDFSHVRLHTDSAAASLSSSIHAKAFTHGNDIYFNQGQFSPNTTEGQKLVAHELTHVVQGGGKVGRKPLYVDPNIPKTVVGSSFIRVHHAKALAKEMVKKSITVLKEMKTSGKYIDLFYYCFDNPNSYDRNNTAGPIKQNNRTSEEKMYDEKRISYVIDNYNKILAELNLGTLEFVPKSDLKSENGTPACGLATNYYDVNGDVDDNKIFVKPGSLLYEWSDQLLLANTIIHELSHRLCGTFDITYFSVDRDNSVDNMVQYRDEQGNVVSAPRNQVNYSTFLIQNAFSYGIFSSWVESTIFSVRDSNWVDTHDATWDLSYYKTYLYNGNPDTDICN